MDILDAQIHLNMNMDESHTLSAMNSLGIQAALIDEVWSLESGHDGDLQPSYRLPNGVSRPVAPGGIAASMRHPDRFSWLLRVNPEDPDLDDQISQVKQSPQGRAIRLNPTPGWETSPAFEAARVGYFEAVARHDLPLFVMTSGRAYLYEPYIRAFPGLRIAFDHCGFPQEVEDFDAILSLARYPNLYLKWGHAPTVFRAQHYPFEEVTPHLLRAIDAFGADRIMWASDFSMIEYTSKVLRRNPPYTWAESLFSLRSSPSLSEHDKEWILGRTARHFLDWPTP